MDSLEFRNTRVGFPVFCLFDEKRAKNIENSLLKALTTLLVCAIIENDSQL